MDIRALAATCLSEVIHDGESLNSSLPHALEKVSPEQRPLLQEMCYGSTRLAPRIRAILSLLMDKPLRQKDRRIEALLVVGIYQLAEMDIPHHAVVNNTVAACNTLGKTWARGLVNAVLRRYQRESESLFDRISAAEGDAFPGWLHQAIYEQWPTHAAQIINASNRRPPMTLRVNGLKSTREDYLATLAAAGIDSSSGQWSPAAVSLSHPRPVTDLPEFDRGSVSVQDEAAQLAAAQLQLEAGMAVLDACAAPGGKCCHILELEPGLQELVAMDIDDKRLQKVRENLDRLQLSARLLKGDASQPPAELQLESFDRILLDVPCSATGVIRRHPDVKCLRRNSDISGFSQTQLAILEGCWPLLKPGGKLLYATCSILNQENDQVIQGFVAKQARASLERLDVDWGVATNCGRQLLPSEDGPDGLYYARLLKTA